MVNAQNKLQAEINRCKDVATQYKSWVRHNTDVVGARQSQIERDCVQIETELSRLARASTRRMCVGVFGASQAGKSYLISSLAAEPGAQLVAKAGDKTLNFIGDINPSTSGKETTGVVTRFSSIETVEDPNFPMELSLLSEMDIAKILSNAYFGDFAESVQKKIASAEIDEVLSSAMAGASNGTADRAFELSTYLKSQLQADVYSANFSAFEGKWRQISDVLENGTVENRVQVYSLFWGKEPLLTQVFEKMIAVLDKLGHPDKVFATSDIFDADANVISVSTLRQIWNGTGFQAAVRTDAGKLHEVDHATLAALVTELKVVIKDPPAEFFSTADLLDFPGARTRSEEKSITESVIGDVLVRGKVAYLFDRYLVDRELTSMLLCVADGPQEVGPLAGMIESWIGVSHGQTAEARTGQDCALFFVATKADLTFNIAAKDAVTNLEDRMHSTLERFGGARSGKADENEILSWVREWEPGEKFKNMYWLRNTSQPSTGILSAGEKNSSEFKETGINDNHSDVFGALRDAVSSSQKVRQHFAEPDTAWEEMLKLNDGGRTYLISNLKRVCHDGFKLAQLEREFCEFSEKLGAMLGEFFADGDAERVFKERMNAVRAALQDVQVCARQQKFGEFLSICYVTEKSLKKLLLKIEKENPDTAPAIVREHEKNWDDLIFGDSQIEIETESVRLMPKEGHDLFAERVLELWDEQLQDALANPRISTYLNIAKENLVTLFNELNEAAKRKGLAEAVAQSSRDASAFPRTSEKLIPHKARIAAMTLNHFINQLGFEEGELSLPTPDKTPLFERFVVEAGEMPNLPTRAEPRAVYHALHWAFGFKHMSESNAKTDDGLAGIDLAANAELGSMIDILTLTTE